MAWKVAVCFLLRWTIGTLKQDMPSEYLTGLIVLYAENLSSLPVLTLREIAMVDYMEDITDIPEWWKKVRNYPQHPFEFPNLEGR